MQRYTVPIKFFVITLCFTLKIAAMQMPARPLDQQLEDFITLKTRIPSPDAPLQTLEQRLQLDAEKVEKHLATKPDLQKRFLDSFNQVLTTFDPNGPTYFQNAITYMIFGHFITLDAAPGETSSLDLAVLLKALKIKRSEVGKNQALKLTDNHPKSGPFIEVAKDKRNERLIISINRVFYAIEMGIFPFAYVSTDGLLTFEALNKCYGNRVPSMGVPLSLTAYDGLPSKSALAFINHELNHMVFTTNFMSIDDGQFIVKATQMNHAYDAYGILYTLIQKNTSTSHSEASAPSLDHVCLYHLGHELGYYHARDSVIYNFPSLPLNKTRFKEWVRAFIQSRHEYINGPLGKVFNLHGQRRNVILDGSLIECWPTDARSHTQPKQYILEPSAPLISLVTFVTERHLITNMPFDEHELQQALETNLGPIQPEQFSDFLSGIFYDLYGELYDMRDGFRAAGLTTFMIWDQNNKYNENGIATILESTFNNFVDRYAPLIPDNEP